MTNLGMMIILFSCSSSSIGEEPINPPVPPASSVEKSEYYVSTTGNDENPGTLTSPWRTIQKAVTTVTPGCVVNIMGGTYYEEIKVTVSGTADKYIVIKNYNDEEVIISGNNKPRELMNLNGVSYTSAEFATVRLPAEIYRPLDMTVASAISPTLSARSLPLPDTMTLPRNIF